MRTTPLLEQHRVLFPQFLVQRPLEPGDQDAPLVPSPLAQERNDRAERTSDQAPADGAQRHQKRHKAAKDVDGGPQPEDPPPPPPLAARFLFSPSIGRGAAPPLPLPLPPPPPLQEGTAAAPPPPPPTPLSPRRRPGTSRGQNAPNGITAGTRSRTPTPGGGGGVAAQGGSQPAAPLGGASTGIRWGVSPAAQMGCLHNRSGSPSGADQP